MNLKLKAVFSIIAVLSLAMALTPGVAFAAEVPSSFSCGSSQPEIVGEITTGEDTIIPDVPNTINFSVSDANTLADIESITVYLYYDADGVYAEPTGNESADVHTFVILTWTPEGGWTIEPTGTMWEIDTANCVTPDLGSTSGDFVLSYIPSPVAQESTSGDAEWHIFLVVDDGSTTPVTSYTEDLEMAWYGSVTINTAGVHWGEVTPGMDFAEGAPSEIADISVTYICNGAYDEQVASTATWAGNASTATLTADALNANEFALRADDNTDLVSAVTVADTYTAIDDTGSLTEEVGDSVITNSVWLKLNATFASDTYAGAIYYQIAQGTY
ncbi:MAG: hypothetical protein WC562_04180 [Dehalococcoidia bacterium]